MDKICVRMFVDICIHGFDTNSWPLLLHMVFVVHEISCFNDTIKNHENWYSMNKYEFTVYRIPVYSRFGFTVFNRFQIKAVSNIK